MNIGGLTIEMVADIANLRTSMGEAKTVTSSAMDDITKSAGIAVEALASLGAITTLAGMGALITSTISGAAELYKLSQVTGVTVESLSALAGPAKLTGTSMDTVSAALVKLSKNMVEAQDGTGKSADAFRALGIDVHNSDGTLKTADQTMLDVAMSLEGFRDGAGKTSVELALFGKTGAELSPMLQALAEKGDLNGKITTEQAEACRQFELAQKKLTMEVAGFFKSIAWDLIPILLKARPILIDLAEITAVAVGVFVIAPAAIALAVSAYEALVVAYTVAGSVGALFTVGMQGISAAVMATVASVGLLNIALGAVMIIFAAFKIAEWAYENFEPARRLMNDFFVAAAIGWEYIKYGAEVAWLGIKAVTMPVIDFISGAWSLYSDMLIASWQLIQSAAAAAWDAIRTQVDAALTWISSAWAPLVNALGAGWSFIKDSAAVAWSGIQTAVSDVLTWVNATWIASIELVAEGLRAIGADGTAAKVSAFAEKLKSATASGDEFKTEMKALDVGLQAGLQSVYKMGEGLVKQSQNHFAAKTSAGDQRDVLKTLTDTTGAAADESKKMMAAWEATEKAGQNLISAIAEKNAQLQTEIDLGRTLTPVEKDLIKLDTELALGKITMSQADIDATREAIKLGAAMEKNIDWQIAAHKENEAAVLATDKKIESIVAETNKQKEANLTLGLTAEQLSAVRQARLLEMAVAADKKAQLLDEIDWTGKLGDQQRDLAQAYRDSAGEARNGDNARAAQAARVAWDQTINDIGKGLTDVLEQAFKSGSGFFGTLWDGIKNLFKTTVLKAIIQPVQAGITGMVGSFLPGSASAGGASGAGGAGGLSSLAGMANSASNWYNGGMNVAGSSAGSWFTDFGGSVGTATSKLGGSLYDMGFEGLGNAIGGAQGAISDFAGVAGDAVGYLNAFNAALNGKWGEAAGAAIGTYFGGPIGSAIGGMLGKLADGLFSGGAGTPHMGGMYVSDAQGGYKPADWVIGTGAGGDSANRNESAQVLAAVKTLGGASVSILDALSKSFGGAGGFKVGAYFAADGHDASMGNTKIWQGNNVVARGDSGAMTSDASAAMKQYTSDIAGTVREAMNVIDLPAWAKKALDSLVGAPSLESLAKTVTEIMAVQNALKNIGDAFAPLGGVFGRIAGLSADATMQLASFAGGIAALAAKSAQFVTDYYSVKEKAGLGASSIMSALSSAGIDGSTLATKDQFRALVDSTDVSTATGQKQLAALLNIAPAFAQLAQYLADNNKTLSQARADAPVIAALAASNAQATANETNTAVATVADNINTSNTLLTKISDGITSMSEATTASLNAMAAATAALAAATAISNAAASSASASLAAMASNASLAASAPSHGSNLGFVNLD